MAVLSKSRRWRDGAQVCQKPRQLCAGQASKTKAIALETMANRYKKDELNAIVK